LRQEPDNSLSVNRSFGGFSFSIAISIVLYTSPKKGSGFKEGLKFWILDSGFLPLEQRRRPRGGFFLK
ncbi:MAG: hypothetical protein K6T65_12515, partial [Peptococcaceae bacterium]|nr:hypothetical protein [Peptococcaceae bacterium]